MAFIINRGKKRGLFYIPSGGTKSPTPTPSAFSTKSLDFDGTDDFISIYDGASGSGPIQFNAGDDFSISAWIKTTNAGATNQIVSFRGTAIIWFSTFKTGANIRLKVYLRDNSSNVYSLDSYNSAAGWIASDTWTNVMFTRNGTSKDVNLYINGVAAQVTGTDTTSDNFTSYDKLSLANDNHAGGRYWFDGNMDEVAIYSSDQSANAATIYNLGTPDDLTSLSPTAWYRMGENSTFYSQILIPSNANKDKVSNYSLSFDGVNDYVDTGAKLSVDGLATASFSLWFKTDSTGYKYIFGDNKNRLLYHQPSSRVDLTFDGAASYRTFSASTVFGDWNNIVITFDGGLAQADRLKVYLNGGTPIANTLAGTTSTTLTSVVNFYFGRAGGYASNPWTGNIDEFSIWNTALTQSEVTEIYNTGTPNNLATHSGTAALVNWWRMGEQATFSTNWTIPDQIGSNNGTSANMTIEDRTGNAPDSNKNALSYNMDAADIVEETPPN